VAILDDVITSGESSIIAAEAAESYKAEVVRVLAVVDREQGASRSSSSEAIRSPLCSRSAS
jgi:orotate phosphoribosyltransferase